MGSIFPNLSAEPHQRDIPRCFEIRSAGVPAAVARASCPLPGAGRSRHRGHPARDGLEGARRPRDRGGTPAPHASTATQNVILGAATVWPCRPLTRRGRDLRFKISDFRPCLAKLAPPGDRLRQLAGEECSLQRKVTPARTDGNQNECRRVGEADSVVRDNDGDQRQKSKPPAGRRLTATSSPGPTSDTQNRLPSLAPSTNGRLSGRGATFPRPDTCRP